MALVSPVLSSLKHFPLKFGTKKCKKGKAKIVKTDKKVLKTVGVSKILVNRVSLEMRARMYRWKR